LLKTKQYFFCEAVPKRQRVRWGRCTHRNHHIAIDIVLSPRNREYKFELDLRKTWKRQTPNAKRQRQQQDQEYIILSLNNHFPTICPENESITLPQNIT
jgi:hypothetical protein